MEQLTNSGKLSDEEVERKFILLPGVKEEIEILVNTNDVNMGSI